MSERLTYSESETMHRWLTWNLAGHAKLVAERIRSPCQFFRQLEKFSWDYSHIEHSRLNSCERLDPGTLTESTSICRNSLRTLCAVWSTHAYCVRTLWTPHNLKRTRVRSSQLWTFFLAWALEAWLVFCDSASSVVDLHTVVSYVLTLSFLVVWKR
jgi:hypothetical protein